MLQTDTTSSEASKPGKSARIKLSRTSSGGRTPQVELSQVWDEMIAKNPDLAVLRNESVGEPRLMTHGKFWRIDGYIKLNSPEVIGALIRLKYEKNREIKQPHLRFLKNEYEADRYVPNNSLSFAEEDNGLVRSVNGNHTIHLTQLVHMDEPFHWTIWLNGGRSDFQSMMYTIYDAGSVKTPKEKVVAIDSATRLGLEKTELTLLDRSVTMLHGDGKNSVSGDNAIYLKSPHNRHTVMEEYMNEFQRYLRALSRVPTTSGSGSHRSVKTLLRNVSVRTAFLQAYKHDPSDRIASFLDCIATDEMSQSGPQQVLWNYFHHNPKYDKLNGGSRYEPLYVATLHAMSAWANETPLTLTQLNKWTLSKTEDSRTVSFGSYSKTYPVQR